MNKDFDDTMMAIGFLACISVQARKLYVETEDVQFERTADQSEEIMNAMIQSALKMKRDEIMEFFKQNMH